MESARRYSSVSMDARSLTMWNNAGQVNSATSGTLSAEGTTQKALMGNRTSLFQDSMNQLMQKFSEISTTKVVSTKQEKDTQMKVKAQCIDFLLQLLFGMKKKNGTETAEGAQNKDTSSLLNLGFMAGTNFNSVVGGTVQNEYYHAESECTAFSTEGKVVTADGRELTFELSFEMSRSFEEAYSEKYDFGTTYVDPLVINLDTDVASVSTQKFMFDIDANGVLDSISNLNGGSGYLALDLNEDGTINDGSELFGTKSGDGFSDLEKYDSDGNGWIDEADDIWNKLLIWTKDTNGNDMLYGLSEKGMGAIYLGNVSTDFSLNSLSDNTANAAIRKTGIFLYENGNVGTVQHLDLAQ